MSNTIYTTYGSCISLDWTFRDESGASEDLTGDSFEIRDAVPASLADDFEITPTDAENGKISVFLDTEGAKKLGIGRVSRFRLCRIKSDGCEDNTNILWIEVR